MEPVGIASQEKSDDGRRAVATGGKEKNCFTVQLPITRSGKKLKPYIIWKGSPQKGPPYKKKHHPI